MTIKEFRLDRKSTGAHQLEGLWGPVKGELLYDMAGRGKGNHATRIGTGPRDQLTDRGRVSLFNGVDDGWDCERRIALALENFTLMCWLWLDSTVPQRYPVIIGQDDVGVRQWALWVDDGDRATAHLEFQSTGIVVAAPAGSFHAVKDQWVHVAVRRWFTAGGAATTAIYQNAQLMGSHPATYSQYNASEILQIGSHDNAAANWWKGNITGVRYYTRALTPAQIHYIYRTTQHNPYADLLLRPTRRYVDRHRGALEAM